MSASSTHVFLWPLIKCLVPIPLKLVASSAIPSQPKSSFAGVDASVDETCGLGKLLCRSRGYNLLLCPPINSTEARVPLQC